VTSKRRKPRPIAARPWTGPWLIHFFQRHQDDDPARGVPGREFLDACPIQVAAKLVAILKAVADAPPFAFAGGGKWEAMHGDMSGYYEARADGPHREHYRVFCILDRNGAAVGLGGPSVVVITGASKPFRTTLSSTDYEEVRALGDELLRRAPRSVAK
jgi:Txe/YoeB family toxin of Txe-Axe toxin-antitoxin module